MKQLFSLLSIALLGCACSFDGSFDSSETGTGGSMARFAIVNNHLYTVDHQNLHSFEITDMTSFQTLRYVNKTNAGFGIETIFPHHNHLFLGAQNGMHIYDLTNPGQPNKLSFTPHFMSNDPVVVNDNYAYVTLRSENVWWRHVNMLQIYDISNLKDPILVKEYSMENPKGLGIDGNLLFICDNRLKVFRLNTPVEIEKIAEFNIPAIDVIPNGNHLYVVASDGFYQYQYADESITLISKIALTYGN